MKCSNTSKAHKRNPKLIYANCQDSKIMVQFSFRIWLHLVEFSSTALRLLRKNICVQKATFQSPRTTNGITTARNVGTAGWIFFTNLHVTWRHTTVFVWFTPSFMHSHMVTSYRFLGGPYRFTWFGAFFNTIGPSLTKVVYAYLIDWLTDW